MDEEKAIALLKKYSADEDSFNIVLSHSKAVQKVALRIANEILENGYFVDTDFIKIAALLHDIGRFKCPPNSKENIKHGVEGAKILKSEGFSEFAEVAEKHIGAGITKEDIEKHKLDLPLKDYVPETIEEKIISHADNLVFGDREGAINEVLEKFKKEAGDSAAKRAKELNDEIEELRKGG